MTSTRRVPGLGYEDLNDHEQLRKDRLFGVLAGREELDKSLAGKSTLNRLELDKWSAGSVQEDHILEASDRRKSAGGDYSRCRHNDLPYVFCGEHVLCARLRQSNSDASAGSVAEIERIVDQVRVA